MGALRPLGGLAGQKPGPAGAPLRVPREIPFAGGQQSSVRGTPQERTEHPPVFVAVSRTRERRIPDKNHLALHQLVFLFPQPLSYALNCAFFKGFELVFFKAALY